MNNKQKQNIKMNTTTARIIFTPIVIIVVVINISVQLKNYFIVLLF